MRALPLFAALAFATSMALSQAASPVPKFEVASVRPSQHQVGPDYNNQITYSADGFTGRNVTLKRLIAEAYRLQLDQILGPRWLDQNEYDINARTAEPSSREQTAPMLQNLLATRFDLATHRELRNMRVYDLVVANSGPKINPIADGKAARSNSGFHFHGDMRHFADLLALQFSMPAAESPSQPVRASSAQIPVIDKTGLQGTFDFTVNVHPELGTDGFTLWQRALQSQLGLRIDSRKEDVPVMVVENATNVPAPN